MTRQKWKNKIKKLCIGAGTYEKYYDMVIDTLAGIMEITDKTITQYENEGAKPVIECQAKNGSIKCIKNPILTIIQECNAQALPYWRDLGLTPLGLKKIADKKIISQDKKHVLNEVLKDLEV